MVRKAEGKTPSLLGRALVKSKATKKNAARRAGGQANAIYHNVVDEDAEETANLQSVMERNALDEFLTTAMMKEQNFAAQKQSIIMVGGSTVVAVQEKKNLEELEYESIRIPRRPVWDFEMPGDELQRRERDAFLEWRRNLAKYEEAATDKTATPFEKNMEVWKQLWRVAERSHVVAQVVDARNPLLFYCEDVFRLSHELDARKKTVLLINKSDYLTREAREVWAKYFTERGINFIFWSAKKQQEILDLQTAKEKERDELRISVVDAAKLMAKKMRLKAMLAQKRTIADAKAKAKAVRTERSAVVASVVPEEQEDDSIEAFYKPKVLVSNEIDLDDDNWMESDDDLEFEQYIDKEALKRIERMAEEHPEEEVDIASRDPARIVGYTELLDYFKFIADKDYVRATYEEAEVRISERTAEKEAFEAEMSPNRHISSKPVSNPAANVLNKAKVVVGMLGFPNVGKSSTINALMGAKKVSVSSTAGHTKHFQTLNLGDDIMLCDCPGLVFPTFVHSRATLVINGVIPVDTLRDFISPVESICARMSRTQITQLYGLDIPNWKQVDAMTLLQCHATMRGFYKDHGRPDETRSARLVLKDFVAGKLLYCQTPPGLSKEERKDFYVSFSRPDALAEGSVLTDVEKRAVGAPLGDSQGKSSKTHLEVRSNKPVVERTNGGFTEDLDFAETEDTVLGLAQSENQDVINVNVDRKKIVTVTPEVDTVTVTKVKTQKERLEELAQASMTKKQLQRMRNNLLKGKQAPIGETFGATMVGTAGMNSKKFFGSVFDPKTGKKVRQ